MKITNEFGLPKQLVDVIESTSYPPKPDRMGVTDLINPPLIRTLKIRHYDELVADVSDYIWMLLGISVDYILNKYDENVITQHKIEMPWQLPTPDRYYTLVGKLDVIDGGSIEDWKVTSVWSFLAGNIKPEWEQQLNCYAFLRSTEIMRPENYDIPQVTGLKINAVLRDWQLSKAVQPDYPRKAAITIPVPLWTYDEQAKFIKERFEDHFCHPMRECTPEEKWQRPTVYALMKKGRKSAIKVENTMEDIRNYVIKKGIVVGEKGYSVVDRPGACVRCDSYCQVLCFCPYNKAKAKGD
jgi:hypothetical protein